MDTQLCDVTIAKAGCDINVIAAVEKKCPLKQWGKAGGSRISFVLYDNTRKIDMIAWSAEANMVAESLKENTTYAFKNLKVNKCSEMYSMASPGIQLVYTPRSSFQESDNSFCKPAIPLVKIAELIADGCTRQTFAGVVASIGMPITSGNGGQRTDITVNDGTATIDVSFWGKSITTFGGNVSDVVLIENCIVKQLGTYTVVNSSSGTISLNPVHPDLQPLYNMDLTGSSIINRSPQKVNPVAISTLEALEERNVQQQVQGKVIGVTFSLYDQCPFIPCRKTVKKLEMDIYSCNKCNRLYRVSATGLRLCLTVQDQKSTKSFVLFNDKAEQLVGMKATTMLSEGVTADHLAQRLNGIIFLFVVSGGRKPDEYLCHSYTRVCGVKDSDALSGKSTPSSDHDIHMNSDCHTPVPAYHCEQTYPAHARMTSVPPSCTFASPFVGGHRRSETVCSSDQIEMGQSSHSPSSDHDIHMNSDCHTPVPAYLCEQTYTAHARMTSVPPSCTFASPVVGGHRRSETVCSSDQIEMGQSSHSRDTSFSDVFDNLGNLLSRYPPSPYAPLEFDVTTGRKRKRSFDIDGILGRD